MVGRMRKCPTSDVEYVDMALKKLGLDYTSVSEGKCEGGLEREGGGGVGGREGGREGVREEGREGGREGGCEGRREGGREGGRV